MSGRGSVGRAGKAGRPVAILPPVAGATGGRAKARAGTARRPAHRGHRHQAGGGIVRRQAVGKAGRAGRADKAGKVTRAGTARPRRVRPVPVGMARRPVREGRGVRGMVRRHPKGQADRPAPVATAHRRNRRHRSTGNRMGNRPGPPALRPAPPVARPMMRRATTPARRVGHRVATALHRPVHQGTPRVAVAVGRRTPLCLHQARPHVPVTALRPPARDMRFPRRPREGGVLRLPQRWASVSAICWQSARRCSTS